MTTFVLPEFCSEWFRIEGRTDAEKRAYIADELRRLDRDGAPLLTVVAAHILDDRVQQIAFEILRRNHDSDGNPVYEPRQWALRLREGATPPKVDAQGRAVPEKESGKVLYAKVGVLGGELGPEAESREVMQWGGPNRDARARQGRDIYRYVKIGREPVTLSLDDALAVVRQWGMCVAPRERRHPTGWRPGMSDDGTGQLNWLVEEVTPTRQTSRKAA